MRGRKPIAGKRPASAQPSASSGKQSFWPPDGYKRLTINLPEALHTKLKLTAIKADCTVTDIVVDLLVKDLLD